MLRYAALLLFLPLRFTHFHVQKQRKKLAEKIAQLNDAIDNVSTQLRSEEAPNGAAVSSDDIEALI